MTYLNGPHGIIAVDAFVLNQPLHGLGCAECDFLAKGKNSLGGDQWYCILSRHLYMTCKRSEYHPDPREGPITDRYLAIQGRRPLEKGL